MMLPKLGFIGAGKVGNTLARLWYQKGIEISAIYSRNRLSAQNLADAVHAKVAMDLSDVMLCADLIFLTVPDDAILDVAELSATSIDRTGIAVVHTSGATGIEVFRSLSNLGVMTGCLHPIFPFANISMSIKRLPGATFAIETDDEILRLWLVKLVQELDGEMIFIPPGKKAYYHAALAIASNFTVTLAAIAEQMLLNLGADRDAAKNALNILIQATVDNIKEFGVLDALTGPLSREDTDTIRAHLASIDDTLLAEVYRGLARLTFPILQQRGIDTVPIEKILKDTEIV